MTRSELHANEICAICGRPSTSCCCPQYPRNWPEFKIECLNCARHLAELKVLQEHVDAMMNGLQAREIK